MRGAVSQTLDLPMQLEARTAELAELRTALKVRQRSKRSRLG